LLDLWGRHIQQLLINKNILQFTYIVGEKKKQTWAKKERISSSKN